MKTIKTALLGISFLMGVSGLTVKSEDIYSQVDRIDERTAYLYHNFSPNQIDRIDRGVSELYQEKQERDEAKRKRSLMLLLTAAGVITVLAEIGLFCTLEYTTDAIVNGYKSVKESFSNTLQNMVTEAVKKSTENTLAQ